MRKPVVLATIGVFILTLIVVGFHYFVQAFLPPDVINFLFIFMLALVAVIGILTGFLDIVDRLSGKSRAEIDEAQNSRNRRNMLQLVWTTWIEGVLKKSLYNEVLIELGMETKPDAIEHPWDMVMQMPDKEHSKVPSGTTMLDLFDQTSGSLLILGEPGSGKTTMLLDLCRQAIERAREDQLQPVPVIFNLASWAPNQTFAEWLVSDLFDKYYVSNKIGRPWIKEDALLLLLDGFDEVRTENREACVEAINEFRTKHSMPMVVCTRKYEYEALKVRLKFRGAVLIQPLTNQRVDEYLQSANVNLTIVSQALYHDPELMQIAQTPLMLSILVLASQNYKEEDLRALGVTGDYRIRLFNFYIAQMFKRLSIYQPFPPDKTQEWLSWIARGVMEHGQTIFFIEDIQPNWLPFSEKRNRLIAGMSIGLLSALIVGLIIGLYGGLIFGFTPKLFQPLLITLVAGLIFGLTIGLSAKLGYIEPTDKLVWSWKYALAGLRGALVTGMVYLVISIAIGLLTSRMIDLLVPVSLTVLIFMLVVGFISGLQGVSVADRRIPEEGISSSLKNFLLILLVCGLFGALVGGLFGGLFGGLIDGIFIGQFGAKEGGLVDKLGGGLVGYLVEIEPLEWFIWSWKNALAGLIVGIFYMLILGTIIAMGIGGGFLIAHFISRWILYRSGNIPWNIINLLEYCTERIFLRKVGGGYIFIHRMLMEHFAEMGLEPEEE